MGGATLGGTGGGCSGQSFRPLPQDRSKNPPHAVSRTPREAESEYCGTHYKYENTDGVDASLVKKMDVIAKEMEGIVYYVDDFKNVYRTEDILNEKDNPQIVAKYEQLANGRYIIR